MLRPGDGLGAAIPDRDATGIGRCGEHNTSTYERASLRVGKCTGCSVLLRDALKLAHCK